jgi:hypothetical protein
MQHPKRAAKRGLGEGAAKDPDAQLFLKRAKEPIEDCLSAIEQRIARISGTASQSELA